MTSSIGQYQGPTYQGLKVPPQNPNLSPSMEANFNVEQAQKDMAAATQNSWIGGIAQGLGIKDGDPKKLIGCILGTIAVVFGISALGRNTNLFKKIGDLGDKISNSIGKWVKNHKGANNAVNGISNKFQQFKTWFCDKNKVTKKLSDNIKAIFAKNSDGVRENLLSPKSSFVKPMLKGTKWEVVDNVTDTLSIMYNTEDPTGWLAFLKKPLRKFTQGTVESKLTNQKLFKEAIEKAGNADKYDDLVRAIKDLNKNSDVDYKFKVYKMVKDALGPTMGKSELLTQKAHGFNVKLYDAIERAEILNGTKAGSAHGKVAKTGFGRFLQKTLFRTMEAPSNGVAARTLFGYSFAIPIYFGVFNKVLSGKKEDMGKKFAEESVGDVGGYMMMPVTSGVMYGAASLLKYFGLSKDTIKNFKTQSKQLNLQYKAATGRAAKKAIKQQFKDLQKTTFKQGSWFEKLLRVPGKVLGMGLESKPGSLFKGKVGGALRFGLFMFALSPLFMKPIMGLCHKIFGMPSDTKAEMEAAKAEKEAKKNAKNNPPLQMSQEELIQKLAERPELVAAIQNDPQLLAQLQQNPQMLLQLIEQTPATVDLNAPTQIPAGVMSPSLKQKLANAGASGASVNPQGALQAQAQPTQMNVQAPQVNTSQANTQQATVQNQQPNVPQLQPNGEPIRTYIPSSAPVVNSTTISNEKQSELQNLYAKADRAEAEAMKYL